MRYTLFKPYFPYIIFNYYLNNVLYILFLNKVSKGCTIYQPLNWYNPSTWTMPTNYLRKKSWMPTIYVYLRNQKDQHCISKLSKVLYHGCEGTMNNKIRQSHMHHTWTKFVLNIQLLSKSHHFFLSNKFFKLLQNIVLYIMKLKEIQNPTEVSSCCLSKSLLKELTSSSNFPQHLPQDLYYYFIKNKTRYSVHIFHPMRILQLLKLLPSLPADRQLYQPMNLPCNMVCPP